MEEQVSNQQTPPSTKKTCPTSVKKRTSGNTKCKRNKKQKEYNKCDESNHKVDEIMYLNVSQQVLTLSYLSLNEVSKER